MAQTLERNYFTSEIGSVRESDKGINAPLAEVSNPFS